MSSAGTSQLTTDEASAPARVSFEDFLRWRHEGTLAEWIDGEAIIITPVSLEHARLREFLARLLGDYAEAHQLGEVLGGPFVMRLPTRPSGREPDLFFVATAHRDRLRETYLDSPTDLVVEIVSPESAIRDWGDTFVEYEAAGMPEHWLIDPIRREAIFYQAGDDGLYHPALVSEGVYHALALPGFWLRVEWLWRQPLPGKAEALRQRGLT